MEYLIDLGLFSAKALVITVAIGAVLILIANLALSSRRKRTGLEIEKLNERYRSYCRQLQAKTLGKKHFKGIAKLDKKARKKDQPREKRLYYLTFNGDIRATAVSSLREEITAILSIAKPGDEVVVAVESGGGLVTSYGLAASQLERVKTRGLHLTICVDKIAASGGYMMACVADRICAAPFAVLGSIGVVAQVPNFNKILKKNDVDFREITAGEFKRTVTVFGEITEPGLTKFKEQIEQTHVLFKDFVSKNRPKLDISKVATGEHWYGTQALALGLCDEIVTSDDYLMSRAETTDLYQLKYLGKRRWSERFSESASSTIRSLFWRFMSDAEEARFGA
ncbi:MAG: protease SohB [Bdellovibrionota bacterium]